jgi:hypothetical protein
MTRSLREEKTYQNLKYWREKNPEEYKAQCARYRLKYRKTTLEKAKVKYDADPVKYRRLSNERRMKSYLEVGPKAYWLRIAVTSAKTRAKLKGLPFDVSFREDLNLPDNCPVYDTPLDYSQLRETKKKGPLENSPSLDRHVPSLGYVRGNVRVLSNKANRLKGDGTLEDHEILLKCLRGTE